MYLESREGVWWLYCKCRPISIKQNLVNLSKRGYFWMYCMLSCNRLLNSICQYLVRFISGDVLLPKPPALLLCKRLVPWRRWQTWQWRQRAVAVWSCWAPCTESTATDRWTVPRIVPASCCPWATLSWRSSWSLETVNEHSLNDVT